MVTMRWSCYDCFIRTHISLHNPSSSELFNKLQCEHLISIVKWGKLQKNWKIFAKSFGDSKYCRIFASSKGDKVIWWIHLRARIRASHARHRGSNPLSTTQNRQLRLSVFFVCNDAEYTTCVVYVIWYVRFCKWTCTQTFQTTTFGYSASFCAARPILYWLGHCKQGWGWADKGSL